MTQTTLELVALGSALALGALVAWVVLLAVADRMLGGPARHRAGGTAPRRSHRPQHDFSEVPPSLVAAARYLAPGDRARMLVHELNQHAYSPWRHVTDPGIRARLLARAEAAARRSVVPA